MVKHLAKESWRKRKRLTFLDGNARRPYHSACTSSDSTSLEGSLVVLAGETSTLSYQSSPGRKVYDSCAPVLNKYAVPFKSLVRQGSELKRRKSINPAPRKPNFQHYRDLVKQNEWLRNNIFDAMGNYLFCNQCVHAAFGVSIKRLAHLRKQKKAQFQHPVKEMTKCAVEEGKLGQYVIMPTDVT